MSMGAGAPHPRRILFVCDAHSAMGFGHASRCLHLARLGTESLPAATNRASVAFQGAFSAGARTRLLSALPGLALHPPEAQIEADVAVIDRMTDAEDLEAWDPELVDNLVGRARRVVYLASGLTAPPLPASVECIGYQPRGPAPSPPAVRWGLEYAPVAVTADAGDVPRDPRRALVAFGGSPDHRALALALDVLRTVQEIRQIDVLLSPVNGEAVPALNSGPHQTVTVHRNVPSVAPLLAGAGLVIASYGHLAWEALALGAPVCLLGQKRFQSDLALALDELGLAGSAGQLDEGAGERLRRTIPRVLSTAAALRARAHAAVDGRGLQRIADIIFQEENAR